MNQTLSKNSLSSLDSLGSDQQERIADIIESCLRRLEQGDSIDPQLVIEAHPELALPLQRCLGSLVTLHEAVHRSSDTVPHVPGHAVEGRLGDFELGDVIGQGGMGIVYAARQISLSRQVAVKVLPLVSTLDHRHLKRFANESQAAASLNHPHIVPIFSVGYERGIHFYAMQLIVGQSLENADRIKLHQDGFHPLVQIMADAAEAIEYAHGQGIIHRDIKPSNLLLQDGKHVWITDFGLARLANESNLTKTGDLVGTLRYMSPEQAAGTPIDERSDVYGLGVTLYELLVGQCAFPEDDRQILLRQVMYDEPPRPRKFNPRIPLDLETIVLKSITKNREDRYRSAGEMADDLHRFISGRPILARRLTLSERAIRWTHRRQKLVATVGVASALIMAILSLSTAMVWRANSQLDESLQTTQNQYYQARTLLDHWNKELLIPLADIPGAEAIHSEMLHSTVNYYASFIEQAEHDRSLRTDLSIARLRLAHALEQFDQPQRALNEYQLAIQELRVRGQSLELAQALNDWGLLTSQTGNSSSAIAAFMESLEIHDQLIANQSAPQVAERELAIVHVNLADAYRRQNQLDKQEEHLLLAEKLQRAMVAKEPNKNDLIAVLAMTLDHLAVHYSTVDIERACLFAEESVSLQRRVWQDNPAAEKPLTYLAAGLHNLGVLSAKAGRPMVARGVFERAAEHRRELARWFPRRARHLSDLAVTLNSLGMLEAQSGNIGIAKEKLESARDSLQTLIEHIVDDEQYRSALEGVLNNLNELSKLDS